MPEQGPECCDGGPELWVGGEMLQDTEGWKEAVKGEPEKNFFELFCLWMTDGNVHRVLLTCAMTSRAAFLQPRLCEAQSGAKLLLSPSEECVNIGQDVTVKVCIKNLCALSTAGNAPYVPAVLKAGAKLEASLACTSSRCTDLFRGVFEIGGRFRGGFEPAKGVEGLSWESGVCTLTAQTWKRTNPQVHVRPVRLAEPFCHMHTHPQEQFIRVVENRRRRRSPSLHAAPSQWVRTSTSQRPASWARLASSVSELSKPRPTPTYHRSPTPPTFLPASPAPLSPAQLMAVALTSICLSAQALAYPEGGATSVA